MRARFSAYVLGNVHFLKQSWAPETCPAQLDADRPSPWKSLTVMPINPDSPDQVHFRATGFDGKDWFALEEHSRFVQDAGGWLYHSGEVEQHRLVPGRNDACPCGSGLKYKRCCLTG